MLTNLSGTLNCPKFSKSLFFLFSLPILIAGLSDCGKILAQDSFSDADIEFFESKVRPLLVENCFECHGPDSEPAEGGLSMISRNSILSGGETGPAIVPGDPQESLLIDSINYGEVYEMPPDTKMDQANIDILTKWVEMGAPWPSSENAEFVKAEGLNIAQRKSEHWCWYGVQTPKIPDVSQPRWPADLIDNFILARLDEAGLTPAAPASRRHLIRRAHFDLIGVPPTPNQVEAFLNDPSDNAFEKVVDQLLASDSYGERWARHWLDLTRYAETCGHEFDYPLPHAFQYRDYLIRALNQDVPYDDFIREHIAGDLLSQPRINASRQFNESILGTGFWFLGEATHGPVDVKADEAGHVDNQIDVMTKTFLGLTVACARCHDHKFDAISTADYYSLAGFLQSSRRQLAMLDPDRKIESAYKESRKRSMVGDSMMARISESLSQTDTNELAQYIETAVVAVRKSAAWSNAGNVKIQGESLTATNQPKGIVEKQKINPTGKFKWDGNQQLWWRDGSVGDQLAFEFETPKAGQIREFNVQAQFTTARDYGQAQFTLDGRPIGAVQDFYSPNIGTRIVSFGPQTLAPGRHEIGVQLTGHNKSAIPRMMIGIDYLQISASEKSTHVLPAEAQQMIERDGLDKSLVNRWIEAIRSEPLSKPTHPLNWLQSIATSSEPRSDSIEKQRAKIEKQSFKYDEFLDSTVLFESFDTGTPKSWFTTGVAFGESSTKPIFSGGSDVLLPPGVVSSGAAGREFCGVLYSPTFEITHDKILIRARGQSVTVRLIIDGYVMDVYNALLFNGCRVEISEPNAYRWYELGADIRNYHGHRAHLEIIDHGSGFAEIDEIRMGNGRPVEPPSSLGKRSFAQESDTIVASLRQVCDLTDVGRRAQSVGGIDDAMFVSFMLKHNLLPKGDKLSKNVNGAQSHISQASQQAPKPMFAVAMTDGTPEDEFVFVRGNSKTLGDVARRRFLEAFDSKPEEFSQSANSGRLELANKIASSKNPLTARVAVNRVWHHLFGRGLVASVNNFGLLGHKPTHPKLLDYLADEFAKDGWSNKRLIKRIMLSQTYRMSSQLNPKAVDIDPNNVLLHRGRIRRLQGEAIRDSILKVTGQLDSKMYGRSVPIHLTSFMSGRGRPGKSGPLDGHSRRSIYTEVRRNFLSPMMLAFDTPIPFNSIGRRNQSNVPAQALILMNDPFVIEQAKKWAAAIVKQGMPVTDRIDHIYKTAFGRPPTQIELDRTHQFLLKHASELGIPEDQLETNQELWADFCHVIFNVKEFIYVH